jgi:hypothetical protein
MARGCAYQWRDQSGKAEWSLDGDVLLLAPEDASPQAFALQECAGISGDGLQVELAFADCRLALQRLGQDGPTLLERLWRTWPSTRAEALRLTGSGSPGRFQGHWQGRPCALLLFQDMLLLAPEGGDLHPVFLALLQRISFDPSAYSVRLTGWDGQALVLDKLAGQTEAFLAAVKAARAALAKEATETAARHLPGLPAVTRTTLAAAWLPGRFMNLVELDRGFPGFTKAFHDSWVRASLRVEEAGALLAWAGPDGCWAGFGRPGLGLEQAGTAAQASEASPASAIDGPDLQSSPSSDPQDSADCLLWLLCGKGDAWLLETLTERDHASYRFTGGAELPLLASQLLCAPQFSREALYQPLESLTGERSGLAVAARELDFLVELRARFKGRAIHGGMDRWRRESGLV